MTKLRMVAAAILIGMCAMSAWAGDTEKVLADVAAKARGTVALVTCTIKGESGEMPIGGQAICIDPAGIFISTALADSGLDPKTIENLVILMPDGDLKTIKAKFLGSDSLFGFSYLQAQEKADFKAVEFVESKLTVGQQVVSAGILAGDGNRTTYFGTGFISAMMRMPGPMVYVTGGRLTNVCSPVFNADGKGIGVVLRQIPLTYQSEALQRPLPLRGEEETAFFIPTSEIIKALKKENVPTGVRRMPWIGIGKFSPITEDNAKLLGIELPAAIIDQVIPNQPAAAVMKDGDIITAVNGQKIERLVSADLTIQNLQRELLKFPAGAVVTFTIVSTNQPAHDVKVTVGEMPKLPTEASQIQDPNLGIMLREKVPLDQWLMKGAAATQEGLVVMAVSKDGPAETAGIKTGELVTQVNEKAVNSRSTYGSIVQEAINKKEPIKLTVLRNNLPVQVSLPVQYKQQ